MDCLPLFLSTLFKRTPTHLSLCPNPDLIWFIALVTSNIVVNIALLICSIVCLSN